MVLNSKLVMERRKDVYILTGKIHSIHSTRDKSICTVDV